MVPLLTPILRPLDKASIGCIPALSLGEPAIPCKEEYSANM